MTTIQRFHRLSPLSAVPHVFVLLLALLCAPFSSAQVPLPRASAPAAGPAAPAPQTAEERARIEALIAQLENEEQRTRLVEQLRLLLRVQEPAPAPENGGALGDLGRLFFGAIAGDLSARLEQILAGVRPIAVMERFADWTTRLVSDPAERDRLFEFFWKLIAIIGAGLAAEHSVRLMLRGATRRLADRPVAGIAARMLQTVLAIGLIALPLAAFAIAATFVGPMLAARPLTALAVGYIVSAYLLVRLVNGIAGMILAPEGEFARLLRISPETAAYLNVWIARFATIGLYGVYALEAGRPLGMPFIVYDSLLRILGLALIVLAAIVILQNREAVARWIDTPPPRDAAIAAEAADGHRAGMGRLVAMIRGYLAAVWHVIAIAYLVLGYMVWAFAIAGGGAFLLRATLLTLGTMVVAKLASALQHRAVSRLFRVSQEIAVRHPLVEVRANRYLSVLRGLVDLVIFVIALSAILEAWGLRGFSWITTDIGRATTTRLMALTFFVGGAILAWEVSSAVIEHRLRALGGPTGYGPRSQRLRTFLPLLRNVIFIFIVTIAGLLILSELGVNIAPLLAGAGVVGLAIGLGSQTLVKDVISGLFILFEDTVNVGDVVEVDGRGGVVEAISIRSIRLRDVSGAVHTIPFSNVSTVKNMTKDFAYYVFDLSVGYGTDLNQVVEVLKRVDEEARSDPDLGRDIIEPIGIDGLDRFADSALVVRARVKTWPGKQWRVGRSYNQRIKQAFDAAGIEIPYPHQVEIQRRAPPLPGGEGGAERAPG
jgi:moderate conductance mechanosensitive channel